MDQPIDEIRGQLAKPQTRTFQIERDAAIDTEARTVSVAFASDKPVEHWMGDLVLSMEPGAIRTDRLANGAPLLMDHSTTDQVGVVESFEINAQEGMARATVRFSDSVRGDEVFRDVKNGIRRSISVGFMMYDIVLVEEKENEPNLYRCNDWEPLEISIVSVPADISVGVGRSRTPITQANFTTASSAESRATNTPLEDKTMTPEEIAAAEAAKAQTAAPAVASVGRSADLQIADEIREWGKQFENGDQLASAYIRENFKDGKFTGTREGFFARVSAETTPSTPVTTPAQQPAQVVERFTQAPTLGEQLINSDAYKSAVKRGSVKGEKLSWDVPGSVRGLTGQRATFTSTGTGADTTVNYLNMPVVQVEQQRLMIRDLLPVGQTNQAAVTYIKETSFTNYADVVGEEGEKPEASFATSVVTAPVRKIAVVGKLTDEMASDYPMLRDYVDTRMRFMVEAKEEQQLLNGTGSSNQITGILQTSGIQTQAKSSDTQLDAIFKAITKVRSVGFFEPDGIVVHPTDWQTLKLAKDANNQYFGGGPFSGTYGVGGFVMESPVWGLKPVITTAIAQGTALVGAFKLGAQIWQRDGIRVDMTTTNEDDFTFNRISLRVEERLALAVYRSLAFCTVTGL